MNTVSNTHTIPLASAMRVASCVIATIAAAAAIVLGVVDGAACPAECGGQSPAQQH
jgi:hypothetical protein